MTTVSIRSAPLRLLGIALLTSLAFGCGDDATGPSTGAGVTGTNTMDQIDLDQALGGLSYADEPEAFGDSELLAAALLEDRTAASEGDEDSLVAEHPALAETNLRRTYLRVLWGRLDGAPGREAVGATAHPLDRGYLDWSGSLEVGEGAVFLVRSILFERPFDHRLPRDDRSRLGWHSYTGPHMDGILVCIVSPIDDTGAARGEVTFSTPLFEQTYAVAELAGLDESFGVDAEGHGVSFTGLVPDSDSCAQGFLAGSWRGRPDADSAVGVYGAFLGRTVSEDGRLVGYLMGRYGVDSAGNRVFAGKVIGRTGRIRGLLGGTWESSDDQVGRGSFQGRWVGRHGQHRGTLQGRFETRPDLDRAGVFRGHWREVRDGGGEV